MIFSSLVFLCIFLPITYLIYTVVPSIKAKNAALIVASLLFYAYGEPIYFLLMILSAVINYASALLIDKKRSKKVLLVINVLLNIGILVVFKYTAFLIGSFNDVTGMDIRIPEIVLPIGISFFTFQALSYVIDVYLGKIEAQKNFFKILLYISFFPQLIAGPIVKYRDINKEIDDRKQTIENTARGLRRFICGLAKKVLVANAVGAVADNIFASNIDDVNIVAAWIGAIAYLLQIYYDFSGYSDMAIGLGRMFGFHFKENFDYPYSAVNIQDFWRRWHISLSTWFKEYVYIPLGGNRKGKGRTYSNKIIVFFLTGLWHGANWTFVVWGLYHGFLLLLEGFVPAIKKLPKFIGHIYTVILVCIGFVIFRADTLTDGLLMIKQMFAGFDFSNATVSLCVEQLTPWFVFALIIGILGAAPIKGVAAKIKEKLYSEETIEGKWIALDRCLYVAAVVLLAICIIRLSGNSYNPFIYFRF